MCYRISGRNFEVHTRFVFDPQQITLILYKSRIALPYKHSKLAEVAKLRPSTSEKVTIGKLQASCYEQGPSCLSFCATLLDECGILLEDEEFEDLQY